MTVVDLAMIKLSAGLFAVFDRTELAYEPTFVVYRPPAIGGKGSPAVGVRWH